MKKEVIILPEDKYLSQFDIHVKPYLTVGEIKLFAEKMLTTDDYCEREIILNQYLLQFCVRESTEFDGMEYEAIKHSGVFDAIQKSIYNLREVFRYVKQATSVNKELGDFLKAIVELATKAEKKMPAREELQESFEAFRKLQEKVDDSEDKEEIV